MHDLQNFFLQYPIRNGVMPDVTGITSSLWLIIALPLLGAFICGVFGRWLGRSNVHLVALSTVLGSLLLSILAFWAINDQGVAVNMGLGAKDQTYMLHADLGRWFSAGGFIVNYGLWVDHLSGILLLVITGVGLLIHLYSTSYMEHDEGYARYFAYLNLFVAMMLTLVMGDNLVMTFVGWEGVGMASYLLIGFWYTDAAKAWAGRKAFITNRVGDFAFLIGMMLLVLTVEASGMQMKVGPGGNYADKGDVTAFSHQGIQVLGPLNYATLSAFATGLGQHPMRMGKDELEKSHDDSVTLDQEIRFGPLAKFHTDANGVGHGATYGGMLTAIMLLFLLGAAGKSAQLPLYVWLPDAMAGPTPVSALIHAATMVTAGVYLFARLNFLLAFSPAAMLAVALVGGCTALFAALIAFAQDDIKKVLAYSTISQLGFMFMGVGMGIWWAAVLHLVTHAFFKACLFLGAGSVMHGNGDETDIKKLGGLRKEMPWTWLTFLIGTVAITGIVPISGFFSKDSILHGVHESELFHGVEGLEPMKYVVWGLGLTAALCTAFYMTRLYLLTFEGERSREAKVAHAHESAWQMTLPLVILATLSIVALVYGIPFIHLSGPHQTLMENFLSPVFINGNSIMAAVNHYTVPTGDEEGWIASLLSAYGIAWALAIVGTGAAFYLYRVYFPSRASESGGSFGQSLKKFAQHKFYVDELYEAIIIRPTKLVANVLYKVVDKLIVDTIFVRGTAFVTQGLGRVLRYGQTGDAQNYATVMALALLGGVGYAIWYALSGGMK